MKTVDPFRVGDHVGWFSGNAICRLPTDYRGVVVYVQEPGSRIPAKWLEEQTAQQGADERFLVRWYIGFTGEPLKKLTTWQAATELYLTCPFCEAVVAAHVKVRTDVYRCLFGPTTWVR